jgi:hypothetical protein
MRDLVAADAENAVPRISTTVIAIFNLANMISSWQWFKMLNFYGETTIPAELFPPGEKSAAFFAWLADHVQITTWKSAGFAKELDGWHEGGRIDAQ